MNATPLDIAAIVFYFLLLGFFGYLTRRSRSFSEYAVGKHSVPTLMVFASLATTIVGPGFSIGFTAKGYNTGFLFYYLCLTYAFQTIVVGLFLAPKLTAYRDCNTIGDVMRKSYGRFAQLLTGIISVGLLVGFTAIMGKIGGATLSAITGWPLGLCLVLVTGTTALLTFTGGLRATIATEAVQFSFKSIIVPVMLLVGVWKSPVSISELAHQASALTAGGYQGMTAIQLFGVALSFLLGEMLLPPYVNRALAAKSTNASRIGFVMAGMFVIVWLAIVAVLGVLGHVLLPADTVADNVFVAVAHHVLPAGIYGLLLAAVIAIVMSSQESVLNSGSVAFVRDIVGTLGNPSERMTLLLAKGSTLGLAAVAIYAAHFAPSIIDGLLILYSIWAPTIILPLLIALYCRKTRPLAGCLAMVLGGTSSLVWQTVFKEPHGIPAILVGMVIAGVGYGIGHLVGKPIEQSQQQQTT